MKLLACTLAVLFATSAHAFNVDGIRSGMSVQELSTHATRQGWQLKSGDGLNYIMGKLDQQQIDSSLTVCNGIVVNYYRSIDPDVDYTNVLSDMLDKYGQPTVVVRRLPVYQAPGQYIPEVFLKWYSQGDRISLSTSPESRDGQGALRFKRGASIAYTVRSTCIKDF
ncbi:hypothetical protein WIX39_022570 [Variovorax sp. AB1(2024)]|uniref:hypothetical protein n=1 Tax=Variovorax sp. AB1(2024) TaxID=3132214 RepID=UPI0030988CD7